MRNVLLTVRVMLAAIVLSAPLAWAQELPDAALPDASVGMGGAEHGSEENDPNGPCLDSRECERGFTCQSGRCTPTPIREAKCGGVAVTSLLAVGVVLARRRRAA